MAFGDERNTQSETTAPERQPALLERAGKLALERPIKPVRVAPDRLVTDKQPTQDTSHERKRQQQVAA